MSSARFTTRSGSRRSGRWSTTSPKAGWRCPFRPGWPGPDFVLPPEDYSQRREGLLRTIDTVRRLWCRETFELSDGTTGPAAKRIYPAPARSEVPVWLTSAGSLETVHSAGQLGAGLLTHLLCQNLEELAKKIVSYREAYTGTGEPRVALMPPTFLGQDREMIRETFRAPFLRTKAACCCRHQATSYREWIQMTSTRRIWNS
ncbi:LLM class flavin-dependent oxidoreductase [Streptomyces chartreusis]|uniref:LLM class flavin-dependent oxidoreductase n=1 Tax=Streptomyces chartreusis TaxID=1969 RepID=A0A7I0NSF5_STRCX|nr:LLM class flavin-dependent oxidoreductase [Streptomyces chartreusis]